MSLNDRADIVAHYPTAGLGGSQNIFVMPDFVTMQISVGRPVDTEGNIIIEDVGVPPTIRVPVTEETLFAEGDPLLETAIAAVTRAATLPYGAAPFEGSAISRPADAVITEEPAAEATPAPTEESAAEATPAPTEEPAAEATPVPTEEPAAEATPAPTEEPAAEATPAPTEEPTAEATPAPTEEPAANAITVVSGGSRVVVRSAPGPEGRILGLVKDGDVYNVLGRSADGKWIRIDFGASGGWINADFVKFNE
jgi:hypothetical protein